MQPSNVISTGAVLAKEPTSLIRPASLRKTLLLPLIGSMVFLCIHPRSLKAQASLAAEDSSAVSVGNDNYTIIRDAVHPLQWYYVPNSPRLTERTISGSSIPEFHLLTYQFRDPKSPGSAIEGGLLQFAATLDVTPTVLAKLKQAIVGLTNLKAEQILLAPLPLKSAQVVLYAPKDGTLISGDSFGSGNAPTIMTQKMIFSIPLTKVGSDVYNEVVNGQTGVPISVALTYGGLTPPAGFTIHVNWDLAYTHYSSDSKFAAKASYFGLWGGSVNSERKDVFDDLQKSGVIKVSITEGSTFKMDQIDKYLQPILNRINEGMIEDMKPPAKVDPASAPDPSAGGFFGSAGYSVSVKSETERRHGTEDVSFDVRQYEDRVTVASGFIGIGSYSPEIKKQLVTVVQPGSWDNAYFVMPIIFNDPRLGIQNVSMTLGLKNGDSEFADSVYTWTPTSDWKDKTGQTSQTAYFPLAGLKAKLGDDAYKSLKFAWKMKVNQMNGTITATDSTAVFDGEKALDSLGEVFDRVGIDGGGLTWRQLDPTSPLDAVQVSLKYGETSVSDTIRPRTTQPGIWLPPDIDFFLVPHSPGQTLPITARIVFLMKDGTQVQWKHNGQDIRKLQDIVDIKDVILRDTDWHK